ncbi:MAG: diacylglycerol kinase, partial [Solobacterium sp.]|nr:diacylglycerol kinase [Solobacterium sp.]
TERNEKIKYIKDLAAGGVLFASLIALAVGILIFVHHLF